MAPKALASAQYEVEDPEEAIELCYQKGWTDGLPVVPPTEEKVWRFLEAAGREPDDVLGIYPTRRRTITVEKVAINAVMAGCLPEHFPVVLAIVETMLEENFVVHIANSTTGGAALGFIVNGPIRKRLGMNYRGNVLGPGNRANSTIGRAIRLIQINAMGSVPGAGGADPAGRDVFDRAELGQPAKYAGYHIVENEEDFPSLLPLHVELGYAPEQSVVTVFSTSGHVQAAAHLEHSADELVGTIAQYLVGTGRLTDNRYGDGFCVVLLPPEHAQHFVRGGWSKADIRKALYERTTRTIAWVKEQGWSPSIWIMPRGGRVLPGDDKKTVAIAGSPEHIYVVIAGGPAGSFFQFLLPYSGPPRSRVIRS